MELQDILTAISTVGFPIVCCGALFWFMNKQQKENTEAINNNTLVMQRLCDKLEVDGVKIQ